MIIATCWSDSHEEMFRKFWFPSIAPRPNDKIIAKRLAQLSENGDFGTSGFNSTCRDKAAFCASLASGPPALALYSDVDVVLFGSEALDAVEEEVGDFDILYQRETDNVRCAGLFAFRCNPPVADFLHHVTEATTPRRHDQEAANLLIRSGQAANVKIGWLSNRFSTICQNDARAFAPPDDMLAFHANGVIGNAAKTDLLRRAIEFKARP